MIAIAILAAAAVPADAANTANIFKTTATDLSVSTNYTTTITPTNATTTDVEFSGSYGATTLTVNGALLSFGTLNDVDTTQSLIITNTSATAGAITLNTASNSLTGQGAVAADLLYVKSGANLTLQSGTGVLTLNLAATGNIDNAGMLSLAGPISITAGKTISFTGAGVTTVGGAIANTTGAVTVNDAGGSVTLNGANLYTGATTVTAGTLNLTSGSLTGSNVTVNGGTLTEASGGSINGTGTTFTLTTGSATLGGVNTYTGATTVSAGTLQIGSGSTGSLSSSSASTVASGATEAFGMATGTTYSGNIADTGTVSGVETTGVTNTLGGVISVAAGQFSQTGAGTTILSGVNTYGGATTVSAGTLQIGNGSTGSITSNSTVATGATEAFNMGIGTTYSGTIADTGTVSGIEASGITNTLGGSISGTGGTFTQTGAGKTILTAANTYTGATTVSAGNLTVSGAGTLAGTTNLSLAANTSFTYLPTAPATTLNLGTGSTLTLASGSEISETFGSTIAAQGAASVTGTVSLAPTGTFTSGTAYTLLTATSGLGTTGTFAVVDPTNFTYVLTLAAGSVKVTPTLATALTTEYWKGATSGVWGYSNGLASGGASNWTTNVGGTATALTPGATANVIFGATNFANQAAMTLGSNMAVNSITVNGTVGNANDTTAFSLANTGNYTLTIGTTATTAGITVNAGSGAVTLNPNIALGVNQTWTNNSSNMLAIGGAINTGSFTLTFAGSGATVVSGSIANTAGLVTVNDAGGSVTLSGVNTYTGNTTVTAGALNLNGGSLNNTAITVNGGTFSENATGSILGTKALVLNNGASSTLAGANTYTGSTTIEGGSTLALTGTIGAVTGTTATATGALVLGNFGSALNGGNLSFSNSTVTTEAFASTTVSAGASTVTSGTGDTIALKAITRTAGSTIDFANTGTITTTTTNALFTGGQQTTLGGYATWNAGATWAVSGTGATAGTISGLADASYNTSFAAGTDVDAGSGTTTGGALTINSLRFNAGASAVNLGGALTVATGGILDTIKVSGAVSISGNSITSGNGADLIVNQYNTGGALTIASQITNNGATSIGLTKSGPGTLIISNASNSYTGVTNVNAGTLQLGAAGSLPSASYLNVFTGATLDLAGNSVTLGSGFGNNGTITNSVTGTPATFTFGANTVSSGGGSFTGAMNVDIAWANATSPMLFFNFNNAGTLTNNGTGTNTVQISGSIGSNLTGIIQNSASSTLRISTFADTFNGPITITAGLLDAEASLNGGTYGGNMFINTGAVFLHGSNTQNITGVISGGGQVQTNQNNLTLSGQNTYTGGTILEGNGNIIANAPETVTGGTAVSGPLGEGSIKWLSGNTLTLTTTYDYSSRFDQTSNFVSLVLPSATTVGAVTLNTGLQITNGGTGGGQLSVIGGTLILGANATYTGLTNLNGTTLQLGPGVTLSSGDNLEIRGNGVFDLNGNSQTLGVLTNNYNNNEFGTVTNTNTTTASTLTVGDGSINGINGNTGGFITSAAGATLNVNWNSTATSKTSTGSFTNTGFLNVNANGAGSPILSGNVANTGALNLNGNSTGSITLSGTVNTTGVITNGGTGTNTTTISGSIGANVTGVTENSATSILALTHTNTYSGTTTVSAGTLRALAQNALGSGNDVVINGGGVLDLENIASTNLGAVNLGLDGTTSGSTIQSTGSGTTSGTQLAVSTGAITVGGTNNTIANTVLLNGSISQDTNSGLTVNGTIKDDTLGTGATLAGTGNVAGPAGVSLSGGNTVSSTGTLTTTGISVSGTGNSISSGTVTGPITYSGGNGFPATLSVNGTATGGAMVSDYSTLSGTGTVSGGVSTSGFAPHIAAGTGTTVGTLTIAGGLTIGSGTNLDVALNSATGAGGTNNGLIAMSGGTLTIGGTALTFNIDALSALTTSSDNGASNFYTVINGASGLGGTALSALTSTFNITGSTDVGHLVTSPGNNNLEIYFTAPAVSVTGTTYSLTTVAGLTTLHAGASTGLTTTITNTGTGTADTLTYSGVGGSTTIGSVSGATISSPPALAKNGGSASDTAQTLSTTAGTAGIATIGSTGTGANGTAGTTPAAMGTTTNTSVTVYSGLMNYTASGSGTWATNANWTDSLSGAVHVAPGLDAGFKNTDTATFSATGGTVDLAGVSPSLKSITFNSGSAYSLTNSNTSAGGLLLNGTGSGLNTGGNNALVAVTTGTDTISAPVILTTSSDVTVSSGQQLTMSGPISSGTTTTGLAINGAGTTILSSSAGNTYTGTTAISGGGKTYITNATGSGTGSGAITVSGTNSQLGIAGNGKVTGPITLSGGGSLYSGASAPTGAQVAANKPGAGTISGVTLTSVLNDNGGNLTFALAAGGTTGLNNPNMTTSFISTNSMVNFTGHDTITLVDLTNGGLTLRQNSSYLLISNSLGDNGFSGLVTSDLNGNLSMDGDGWVVGVYNGSGALSNNTPFTFAEFGSDGVTPLTNIDGNGKDVSYLTPTLYLQGGNLEVVPEPGTWALMLGGLGVLVLWQRRKSKAGQFSNLDRHLVSKPGKRQA